MENLPTIVIVGRPNVGKSTLLNRIFGSREAIVEEKPGVTRDSKEVIAEWQGVNFKVVDTGGWLAKGSEIDGKVSKMAEAAFDEADLIFFVTDQSVGMTDEDTKFARRIYDAKAPVMLIVNKVDVEKHKLNIHDFLSLGLGDPHPVSSLHGLGLGDVLDIAVSNFPEVNEPDIDLDEQEAIFADGEKIEELFSVAIVGRPNVGKSTLFNKLIGEERSIVHDMSGTTRDTVDTIIETQEGPLKFLDTAGMRRTSRIDEETEYYSVLRSLKAIDSANLALLVIDASEGITHQDRRLAERVDAAGCPIVVILNKVDLLDTEQKLQLNDDIKQRLAFLPNIDVHRTSAINSKGLSKILPSLNNALDSYTTRVPTRIVNNIVRAAQQSTPAPAGGRILYATQGATDPPTFTLFVNKALPNSYLRYIERCIREECDLGSTPINIRTKLRNE